MSVSPLPPGQTEGVFKTYPRPGKIYTKYSLEEEGHSMWWHRPMFRRNFKAKGPDGKLWNVTISFNCNGVKNHWCGNITNGVYDFCTPNYKTLHETIQNLKIQILVRKRPELRKVFEKMGTEI